MIEPPSGDYHDRPNRTFQQPLYSEKIFSDRKIFFMDLKENDRGRFVKITEDVRGRRDTIMLPVDVLDDFLEALNRVADFDEDLDARAPSSEPGEEAAEKPAEPAED